MNAGRTGEGGWHEWVELYRVIGGTVSLLLSKALSCRRAAERFGVSAASEIRWRQLVLAHGTPAGKVRAATIARRRSSTVQPSFWKPSSGSLIRRRGRCRRGQRLRACIPFGHWKTTTFTAGLRRTGIVASSVLDGPMNTDPVLTYVTRVLEPELP